MSTRIHLRYAATCAACAKALPARSTAVWDRTTKTATCLDCNASPPLVGQGLRLVAEDVADAGLVDHAVQEPAVPAVLVRGIAGGSARMIADRQQATRLRAKQEEDQVTRDAHPRIGTLLVRVRHLRAEPERPTSWQQGAAGEEAVGRRFERLIREGFAVLHDRRKPGSRWNIDHIVVGPQGVYVIDAKGPPHN